MGFIRTLLSKGLYFGAIAGIKGGYIAHVRDGFLRRTALQWMSADEVANRQLQALRRLIRHAVTHVPYYRRLHARGMLPEYIASLEDMHSVPILTKETVAAAPEDLIAENTNMATLSPRRSGGSTGDPLRFYVSEAAAVEAGASEIWGDSLAGYRLGDPVVSIWGSHFDVPPKPPARERVTRYLQNRETVISDRMDAECLAAMCRQASAFRPTILLGYLSALVEIAKYVVDSRSDGPDFPTKAIISAAEPLTQARRQLLERVFRRPVFNRYGTREAGLVAMECDRREGLHVDCESLWVDVCPDHCGAEGLSRIVVTKLNEFAMPLIRYDLGDYTSSDFGRCSCGRGFPTIGQVRGRQISLIRKRDGGAITGEVFIAFLDFQPVRSYRVVQEMDYSVRIQVVPDTAYDDACEANILDKLQRIVGETIPIGIERCSVIPRTPSGKLLPVLSHVILPQQNMEM